MKLFLDSCKIDELRYALEYWDIDGVTSNPRHVMASGKPFLTAIADVAELFAGTTKPISVEVNPHHTDADAMVEEALTLAPLSPNFVIKLPATDAGYKACRILRARDIRVNMTLCFNVTQALQAARMGATYASIFVGWKEASSEEISHFVEEVVQSIANYDYPTEVLVAAVRNGRQIAEAAAVGAHIVTAGFDVYKEAFDHPYTHVGLKRFSDAWDATPYR